MKGLIGCQEPERRRRPPVFLEEPAPPFDLASWEKRIRFSAAPSSCASWALIHFPLPALPERAGASLPPVVCRYRGLGDAAGPRPAL